MLDTKTVDRRKLRFASLSDLQAELERIERAHAAGTLRATGNWSPGQILGHLAAWLGYAWEGYPEAIRAPWFVRLLMGARKAKFLASDLPVGFRIPKLEGGTIATEPLPFQEGMARYKKALEPLARGEAPPFPSPIFGQMTSAECLQLNLRHAELHLGFLHY